jgi:hypothetical protein
MKKIFYKIISHLFPIRFDSFDEFVHAARRSTFIVTTKQIYYPASAFGYDEVMMPLNGTYVMQLRGKKEGSFDILCTVCLGLIIGGKENPFLDIEQRKENILSTLKSFNLLTDN